MKNNRLISRDEAAELLNCTPQTISNWVKSGVLTPHYIGQRTYIDKNTLLQYLDTEQDVINTSERISKLRDELKMTEAELRECLKDRLYAIGLLRTEGGHVTSDFLLAILAAYRKSLTQYEYEVLCDFIDTPKHGYSSLHIPMQYGLTTKRVFQIAAAGIRKIQRTKITQQQYAELSEENKSLQEENKSLKNENQFLQEQIKLLRNKLKEITGEEELNLAAQVKYGPIINKKIVDCDLSIRALNTLKSLEVTTIADLVRLDMSVIKKCRNCGFKTCREIELLLESHNLSFGMNI
jgi:excisionase family DNA binding protein